MLILNLFVTATKCSAVLVLDQHPPQTAFPIGWLIMWWICARRKNEPIGGWLAYYYYQLYVGIMVSAFIVFGLNLHSYIPENFSGDTQRYFLFLASMLPSLVTMLFQVAVASFLLAWRTWDLVELLRKILIAQAVADGVKLVIDAKYFPDSVVFGWISFVPSLLWVAYFFRSARVVRVFKTHDWRFATPNIGAV